MSCLTCLSPYAEHLPWYAIRTRRNCEKAVGSGLAAKGFDCFVPSHTSCRRWSDRTIKIECPLFPGYVFCRFHPHQRLSILSTPGVILIVSFGNVPAPIPAKEIESIQAILRSGLPVEPSPFLSEGQRVRIRHGALKDVDGILIKKRSKFRFVVSIELLQRSIVAEVDRDLLIPL